MKKIPSFTIDHIRLLRGIYVSRKDEVNGEVITTFDIRMKEPNREPALGQGALHTIELCFIILIPPPFIWKIKNAMWLIVSNHIANCTNFRRYIQPKLDFILPKIGIFRFSQSYFHLYSS